MTLTKNNVVVGLQGNPQMVVPRVLVKALHTLTEVGTAPLVYLSR
jgi:hypothetical protein